MTNSIEFPNSIYEFLLENSFKDTDEVYTNGSLLIPTFRVKQAIEHYYKPCEDCVSREEVINIVHKLAQPCDDRLDWDISADGMIDGIKSLPSVTPQPCEDAISREDAINVAIDAVDEWDGGCNTSRATMISNAIKELPSVTPSYNSIKTELKPSEDCISRKEVLSKINTLVAEYIPLMPTGWTLPLNIAKTINELPSVTPSHEDLKEAYIKGYDYGVKDWFKAKTDKPDIKAEIIKRIEQVRDNDKNAGEYPYNRCIEIIKEVMG